MLFRTFAMVVIARKRNPEKAGRWYDFQQAVSLLQGTEMDQMAQEAAADAHRLLPPADGWEGHEVSIQEIEYQPAAKQKFGYLHVWSLLVFRQDGDGIQMKNGVTYQLTESAEPNPVDILAWFMNQYPPAAGWQGHRAEPFTQLVQFVDAEPGLPMD